jgi:saccharopine dehydrogenase-like NADP-dependent oxidoreductase
MQRNILLFGAGKSATVLIDYLIAESANENWLVNIVDADEKIILGKTKGHPHTKAIVINIEKDEAQRKALVAAASIVISLLPPQLHFLVAQDCVTHKKNLLTASYVDDNIKSLEKEVNDNKLLFLCEMGLDPGIDHMSAMQLIDDIKSKDGKITSFKSHCGGLVAPESDDNPWHYKISWNPKNVVLAGKAGAKFILDGEQKFVPYKELFKDAKYVFFEGLDALTYYPNRDSLSYIPIYKLEDATTFIRTTVRHPDFMYGWQNIVELNLTDEYKIYETDGKTLAAVFKEHLDKQDFGNWLTNKMMHNLSHTKEILEKLTQLVEAEDEAIDVGQPVSDSFLSVNEKGDLENVQLDDVKNNAANIMAVQMHQNNLTLKLLFYLGLNDDETIVNKGICSAADILQFALENKLKLANTDKDMIVMQHEIDYIAHGNKHKVTSSLIVKGVDAQRTAMAKTVGLPLGIAAKYILNGTIQKTGLHIPITKDIYEPVLKELQNFDIRFTEK